MPEGDNELDTSPVPELSGQQRRCHLLLMLYTPEPELQLETLSRINGVAPDNPARYSRGGQ